MTYLNLGCGSKFHQAWINIDMYAEDESILAYNFLDNIPFQDNYFDVVYHSHVLEHFPKKKAVPFIKECYRVLKPGGVIRIVFPDLEKIVHEYLKHLQRLDSGDKSAEWDYDWILLEMYDQTVRNENGGEMIHYLKDAQCKSKEYINYRLGLSSTNNIKTIGPAFDDNEQREIIKIIREREKKKKHFNLAFKKAKNLKDRILISLLSKREREHLKIGRFRNNGEIHQWMYDRFSSKRLLEQCGFVGFEVRSANQSYIENWNQFSLDNPIDNSSLFVEAVKPTNY